MTTAALQARYPLTQGVNPWLVTVAVMLPTFMEVLDTAIASVALPQFAGSPNTLPPALRTASAN
jgi:DHA2 family multidrug resistance protein